MKSMIVFMTDFNLIFRPFTSNIYFRTVFKPSALQSIEQILKQTEKTL